MHALWDRALKSNPEGGCNSPIIPALRRPSTAESPSYLPNAQPLLSPSPGLSREEGDCPQLLTLGPEVILQACSPHLLLYLSNDPFRQLQGNGLSI